MGRLRRSLYVGNKTEYFSGEIVAATFRGAIAGLKMSDLVGLWRRSRRMLDHRESRNEPRGRNVNITMNLIYSYLIWANTANNCCRYLLLSLFSHQFLFSKLRFNTSLVEQFFLDQTSDIHISQKHGIQ